MAGFECLTLAGSVDLEMFGPAREQLSESTLSSCFGGKLPPEIPKKTQLAQLPSYSQDWSNQLQNSTGFDLREVSAWLPSANIEGGRNSKVTVEISFDSLKRHQISDIAQTFRDKIASSADPKTQNKLDSCRKRLCKPNYLTVVEVLSGYPKITITTDGEFKVDAQAGWDAKKVELGVNTEGSASKKNKIVMQRTTEAGPVVVAARVMSLSESMSTDNLCGDNAMSIAGTESPRPLTPTKINNLNLQVDLPDGATVTSDNNSPAAIINGGGVWLALRLETGSVANSPEEFLKESKGDNNQRDLKIEILVDGWIVTSTSDIHVDGVTSIVYGVVSLRQFGAKKYLCISGSTNTQEQAINAKVCKSLRP